MKPRRSTATEVRDAFKQAGVKVLAGDWTNGDPAITRFLESRGPGGRAALPLVCAGQAAGGAAAGAHARRCLLPALRPVTALGARCHTFFPPTQVSSTSRPRQRLRIDLGRVAVDEDEVGPFARLERADLLLRQSRHKPPRA